MKREFLVQIVTITLTNDQKSRFRMRQKQINLAKKTRKKTYLSKRILNIFLVKKMNLLKDEVARC